MLVHPFARRDVAFAKPMIWLNLRIGSPSRIGVTAILWPRRIRSRAVRPAAVSPCWTMSMAMATLSSAWRRTVRGAGLTGAFI
jgi:hypothetical protein